SVMLLVGKLIIIRKFNRLVFSSQLGFTVFSLELWSMGNDNDYVLIVTELQPGAPCCIGFGTQEWCLSWRKSLVRVVGIMAMLVVFKSDIYKGASGVTDRTVLGKDVFDKRLNHWHKEVVGEIIEQLKHGVFSGDKEFICRNSWKSCDNVEVNRNNRALEMQLEVILSFTSSWNVGYGSWMLYKYSTCIKVSTQHSIQYHITRDTLLKLVVVQFTRGDHLLWALC
ncbi:hypothetical protein MKW92_031884, partial [Papaver armeniacum]